MKVKTHYIWLVMCVWVTHVIVTLEVSCPLAAQSVCVQRVCAGEESARVSSGPAVRALPIRVPLQDHAVRKLPLPWGNHQVGVNFFTPLFLRRDRHTNKHTKHQGCVFADIIYAHDSLSHPQSLTVTSLCLSFLSVLRFHFYLSPF